MKHIGFVITAGHLDIEWYQPMRSYRFWTMQIMEDLLRIDRERSDFKNYVLDGQVFPLEEHLRVMPGDREALEKLVRDGTLSVGPFYTQFDEWLPSAEAIIRNCLYGRRKAQAYGAIMNAGYLPDNFGHPRQLPQILRGFGIDSLLFMRGMPEVAGDHPDEFLYEGLDGSKVWASHFRESYGGAFDLFAKSVDPIQPRDVPYYEPYLSYEWHRQLAWHEDPAAIARNMVANVRDIVQRYPSGVVPLISGYDHLPPQPNIGHCIRLANEMQQNIEFRWGTPEQYIDLVRQRSAQPWVYAEELLGSRHQYVLLGALSTRCYLKREHFAAEALLERYAEPLLVLAAQAGEAPVRALVDEAWTGVLVNSAHDSIHGSSTDEVHLEMQARYAASRQIAAGMIHHSLKALGRRLAPWWKAGQRPLLAYVPVPSPEQQLCEVWAAVGDSPVIVCDDQGRALPTQVLPREEIPRNGIGLPSRDAYPDASLRRVLFLDRFADGQLRSYAVVPAVESAAGQPLAQDEMENEYLLVRAEGALLHILDKRSGHWYHNLNLLEEDADAGDVWDFSAPWTPGEHNLSTGVAFTTRRVEGGPVRQALEQRGVLRVPEELTGDRRSQHRVDLPVTLRVELLAGTPRVDVTLTLQNSARDHRIRLCVPLGIVSSAIRSQGHLAVLDRPIARPVELEPWLQPPTRLLPMREWVAADDGVQGLAVALQGVYDYEADIDPLSRRPDVRFTLLRGVGVMGRLHTRQRDGGASMAVPTPGAQCHGEHIIRWAYAPYLAHADDAAPFLPVVQAFLYPPVVHALRAEAAAPMALPRMPRWSAPNICFSAYKPGWDGGAVLRLYENQGRGGDVAVEIPGARRVWLADMNEQPIEELPLRKGHVQVAFAPWQCVSLLLELQEAAPWR